MADQTSTLIQLDGADQRMISDAIGILTKVIDQGDVAAVERGQLMAARDLIVGALGQPRGQSEDVYKATPDTEAYFTMVDAAQRKGVSYHTVSRAVRRHRLTHHRIGRQVLIACVDLDAWRPMVERRPKRYASRLPDTNVMPSIVGEVAA